jgi:purine-binding chemotaxis protein CheW
MGRDLRLITFRVGAELFAADIMAVRQVVQYEGATAVPAAPAFVEGIIVVRHEVVPVIDLRRRFFPALTKPDEQPYVMVIGTEAGSIGLKVDEVRTIAPTNTDALMPAPPLVNGISGDYLVAVVQHRDELLLVLDLEAILTSDEQRTLQSSELSPSSDATSER